MDDTWSVAEAKARLSEVIDKAIDGEPQLITRNGKHAVVMVSVEQWEARAKRQGRLIDFFLDAPVRQHNALEAGRFPGRSRKVDLG